MGGVGGVGGVGVPPGLRERKKEATRRALSWAAVRLALEHGLAKVRVDDIAAAAGVSPRTYNNYFSCREEAICALQAERAKMVGAAVRDRPAGEPLAEAIRNAVVEVYLGEHEPDWAMMRLIVSTPVLHGELLKAFAGIERSLADAIAERVGDDSNTDSNRDSDNNSDSHEDSKSDSDGDSGRPQLSARVLAASVAGTIRVSIEHWLHSGPQTGFGSVLTEALDRIAPLAAAYQPAPEDTSS